MATKTRINPRYRAFGKARLDIARRVKTQEDWDALWKEPSQAFPFRWAPGWRHCIEYRVADYAAEVGFYIDVLGFSVEAFGENYARLTSPTGDFFIGIAPAADGEGHVSPEGASTPEAFRLQFAIQYLTATVAELERRGIPFEQPPQALQEGERLLIATFHTPHGIAVDLFGEDPLEAIRPEADQAEAGLPEYGEPEEESQGPEAEVAEPEPFYFETPRRENLPQEAAPGPASTNQHTRPQPGRSEPARREPVRQGNIRNRLPPNQAARPEVSRPASPKRESAPVEPARPEPLRREPARPDSRAGETPRPGSPHRQRSRPPLPEDEMFFTPDPNDE